MGDSTLVTRTLERADHDRKVAVLLDAFLLDASERKVEQYRRIFEPDRAHGVFDGDELIGVGEWLALNMTLPGGALCPSAAVTMVGVRPGHRRRGVLSRVMHAQLEALHTSGVPMAALYASEGSIYGRFGYAVATFQAQLTLPQGATFRSTVDCDQRPVREVPRDEGLAFRHSFYPTVAGNHVGWLSGDATSWEVRVIEDRANRGDQQQLRYVLHPDGYVLYRAKTGWNPRGPAYEVEIVELVAGTSQAYAALWRYLLDLDLVRVVSWDKAAVDESVVSMLANPRLAVRNVVDGLWVRLVDIDRALEARHYSAPLDVVLELTDTFCPWNVGRWRLRVGTDGTARVARTDDSADLVADVTDLAAGYLGGTTLCALHRAGRITEVAEGSVQRISRAFATDHAPHCQEPF